MEDLKRIAGGASAFFNRAVQFTGEKLGTAEHTDLDAHFERLIERAEKTRLQTERLLRFTESVIHPDPTSRAEDFIYDQLGKTGLETKKKEKISNVGQLGSVMLEASATYGPGSAYGNDLLKVGQTEQQLGQCEKDFTTRATREYLTPLKAYLEGDMKTIAKEKRSLELKRLDLDAAKSRLKRAKSEKAKSDTKMTAVQIEAESDLRVAQSEFDKQAEVTKLLLEGVSSAHAHHSRCLHDFVEAQAAYYASCHHYMQDLQRQLGSNASIIGGGGQSQHFVASTGQSSDFSSATLSSTSTRDFTPKNGGFASLVADAPTQRARVLYDYDASNPSELNLTADEVKFCMVERSDSWVCQKFNFKLVFKADRHGQFFVSVEATDKSSGTGMPLCDVIWEHAMGKGRRDGDIVYINGNSMDNRLSNLSLAPTEVNTPLNPPLKPVCDDLLYWNCLDQLVYEDLWLNLPDILHFLYSTDAISQKYTHYPESQLASHPDVFECHYLPCCNLEKTRFQYDCCGLCRSVRYCSPLCQQLDWPVHRLHCELVRTQLMLKTSPAIRNDLHPTKLHPIVDNESKVVPNSLYLSGPER